MLTVFYYALYLLCGAGGLSTAERALLCTGGDGLSIKACYCWQCWVKSLYATSCWLHYGCFEAKTHGVRRIRWPIAPHATYPTNISTFNPDDRLYVQYDRDRHLYADTAVKCCHRQYPR